MEIDVVVLCAILDSYKRLVESVGKFLTTTHLADDDIDPDGRMWMREVLRLDYIYKEAEEFYQDISKERHDEIKEEAYKIVSQSIKEKDLLEINKNGN